MIELAAIVLTVLVIGNAGVMLYYTWRVRRLRRRGQDLKAVAEQLSSDSRAMRDLWAQVADERHKYEAAAEQARTLALDPPLDTAPFDRLEREYLRRLRSGLLIVHRYGGVTFQIGLKDLDREHALTALENARRCLEGLPEWPTPPPPTPDEPGGSGATSWPS